MSREIIYLKAISEGYAAGMRGDPTSFIVGEGIAARGGCFGHTVGLYKEFGADRVIDTPISEAGFVGMCAAAAACGSRAVADMMYSDFILLTLDQLINQAAKMHYVSGGQFKMPLTLGAIYGITGSAGCHHSQSFHPWFMYVPGIRVVMPSTPYDVKGLMASAIMDDNIAIVLLHRALLRLKGDVPENDYRIPLGQANVVREGSDVTIATVGLMVHHSLKAAETLQSQGIGAEVIDLRTVAPLDEETILKSVEKTRRLIVVDEGYATCGVGAEIAARVQEKMHGQLKSPIGRLHTVGVPIPFSPVLENAALPTPEKIVAAITKMR
jgi:pyruvate dehydrogenase E1 component beta subunit